MLMPPRRDLCFGATMDAAFSICLFALDRVRTVVMALSVIVLLKVIWLLLAGAN